MFTRNNRVPHNIASASRTALAQPQYAYATLADGARLRLRRLSWIEALLLWEEFSAALLGLLETANVGAGPPPGPSASVGAGPCPAQEAPAGEAWPRPYEVLASLPALALRLAAICAEQDEAALAQREACDVLAIAAAALRCNFIAPKGVADFFAALAELSG